MTCEIASADLAEAASSVVAIEDNEGPKADPYVNIRRCWLVSLQTYPLKWEI